MGTSGLISQMMEGEGFFRGAVWARTFLLLVVCFHVTSAGGPRYVCPDPGTLQPCFCKVKSKGLDVVCEATDTTHITKAMNALKEKHDSVIFYMKLRTNDFPKLTDYFFLGLDVRHLIMISNKLSVIEEVSLSSLGNVESLDLSRNYLVTVPSPALRRLDSLLFLNLNHNKITVIHNKAFEGLDKLERLSLYGNRITTIEDNAFKGLQRFITAGTKRDLIRLNLGSNGLVTIPTKALSILHNLNKLELQENHISNVAQGDLTGLVSLDSLNLAHNRIHHLQANAFSQLSNLNALELELNTITLVDNQSFVGLEEKLEWLQLGDNNIHTIPSNALSILHRLRQLDLRSNNITAIHEDSFRGYGSTIKFLYLQKNHIKSIPTMAFQNLHSLEWLYMFNNELTTIPEEVMEPVIDTLRVIDIHDNPLVCDCELRWYKRWLQMMEDNVKDRMIERETMCVTPDNQQQHTLEEVHVEQMFCSLPHVGQTANSGHRTAPMVAFLLAFVGATFTPIRRASLSFVTPGRASYATVTGCLVVAVIAVLCHSTLLL